MWRRLGRKIEGMKVEKNDICGLMVRGVFLKDEKLLVL